MDWLTVGLKKLSSAILHIKRQEPGSRRGVKRLRTLEQSVSSWSTAGQIRNGSTPTVCHMESYVFFKGGSSLTELSILLPLVPSFVSFPSTGREETEWLQSQVAHPLLP